MTRDEVIALAHESDEYTDEGGQHVYAFAFDELKRAFEAVAAREREATDKLRAFAQAILKDQPDCNDLDMGVKHGLLVGTMKTEPCQEEGCNCASAGEFPMLCFTKTSLLTGVDHG